jgi:hypothetical protein
MYEVLRCFIAKNLNTAQQHIKYSQEPRLRSSRDDNFISGHGKLKVASYTCQLLYLQLEKFFWIF